MVNVRIRTGAVILYCCRLGVPVSKTPEEVIAEASIPHFLLSFLKSLDVFEGGV
jgi:hypothetical protein